MKENNRNRGLEYPLSIFLGALGASIFFGIWKESIEAGFFMMFLLSFIFRLVEDAIEYFKRPIQ